MATISDTQLERVKKLYSKELFSANEIAHELSVDIHAVYYFMRKHKIDRRNRRESNLAIFRKRPLSFSILEELTLNQDLLKKVGIVLYWTEGSKTGGNVDFANSDEKMCKLFMRFLREICRVDELRLRGYLYCHENQKADELMKYWSRELKIPLSQFTKPYVRSREVVSTKRRVREMKNGLIHIRYSDKRLLDQINEWIRDFSI